MEALGSVASVISVIHLALQSTKTIYEVASSISHGSDDINRLARAIENLEKLLKATKRRAERAERTITVAEGKLMEDLQPLVGQCADALREIPPKLVQLQEDSRDGRLRKAKKYAKVYLDTKGVAEIWRTVNHYVELLGSCLGTASVDVGLYNAQKLHLLHDELSAASRDNNSHLSHVQEVLRDQRVLAEAGLDAFRAEVRHESLDARLAATTQTRGIAEVKTWQQQFGKAATVGYENIRTDVQILRDTIDNRSHQATIRSEALMTEVREGMSESINTSVAQIEEVRRMKAGVTHGLHSISDRLRGIPSIASEQLSTLQSLVDMLSRMHLEMRPGDQKSLKKPISGEYFTATDRCNDMDLSSDSEIKEILARIYHFADKVTTCRYSKEAQSVIEDTGRLLGLVTQHLSATSPSRDELTRKRKIPSDYHYSELETAVQSMENLEKTKRVLAAAPGVRVSNQDTRHIGRENLSAILLPDHSSDSLLTYSRRRRVPSINFQSSVGSWTLQHSRLDAFFRTMLLPDAEDQDTESANEAFAARLLITPVSAPSSNFQIVIDLALKTHQDRAIYFTPTLTFRAMVPDDSEVFRVVEGGSVKKLKKLISSGRASLGDCDSMGRSLLNFALYKRRRRMTSFLIQSGADVDTLEPGQTGFSDFLIKPLRMIHWVNDEDSVDEEHERAEACYKLLLDAGSDISSVLNDDCSSAFSVALADGDLSKVKALIDLGEPFISLECTGDNNPYGTTPLLFLADLHFLHLETSFQMTEKIALLLSRGANVKARDSRGRTCLHLVLSAHDHLERRCWFDDGGARLWRHLCKTKDTVILMISAGADVCAIDEEGYSVSDVAINSGQLALWTETLKYCGIDIKDVLARPNVDPAHSTALSSEYSQPHRSVTSKVSLKEYLERRKAFRVPEENEIEGREACLDSSEDDDSVDDRIGDDESEDDESWDDESEGEWSESMDWAEDTSEASEIDKKEYDDGNHEFPIQYGGGITKGKAKLD